MKLVMALTQDEVDYVLDQYRQRSQAVKEKVLDTVLNASGCLNLDDVYNMDISDLMLTRKQINEIIEIRKKNNKALFKNI